MKKSLPKLLGVIAMLALVGCGDVTDSATPNTSTSAGTSETTGTSENKITVSEVKITDSDGNAIDSEISVFDGSNYSLKAVVTADGGTKKVEWTTSDSKVATVTNGTVKFLSVTEEKKVTITAAAKDDKTKTASVTFKVIHSVVDLKNSRGNDLDTSLYMSDDVISFSAGDSAVLLSDVHGTKWYVQADIKITGFLESDNYPKFGIMSGNKQGNWNTTTANDLVYNNFFYVDAMKSSLSTGWNTYNVVCQNEALTDWDWNSQLGSFKGDFNVRTDETFTMGMLRDGQDYYMFLYQAGEDETDFTPTCVKHVVDKHIDADMDTYAWFGGWATGAEISNVKALTGDATDKMYATPTSLSLPLASDNIYIGKTYQLEPELDVINYDRNKLTYTSSDTTIATVDENGLITASSEKTGEVTITVAYGELTTQFKANVTNDSTLFIELDGKMDDSAWNDTIKANKYRLSLASSQYIDFYVTRNARGVYMFADGYFTSIKGDNAATDWWENENWECKFKDSTGTNYASNANDGSQIWISGNKTSNFDEYYVTDETKGEGESFYNIKFEVFYSYSSMNQGRTTNLASENSTLLFWCGSNPVTGWKETSNLTLTITKKGFVHGANNDEYCSDGNHAGSWVETVEHTCGAAGTATRTCTYCGKVEQKEVPADPTAHVFDLENATVKTAATCTTEGVATAKCKVCNAEQEVKLDKDPLNHTGTKADNLHGYSCCGNYLSKATVFDYPASQNWITTNYIVGVMDGSADWTAELDFTQVRTNGNSDAARGWAGQIEIEDADGNFTNSDNNKFVWRQDWDGWGYFNKSASDEGKSPWEGNCGEHDCDKVFTNGFSDYKDSVADNCHVVQTYAYSHETGIVTIDITVTALAGSEKGKTATLNYSSRAFTKDKKMLIGFGMLWNMEGTHTINSVKLTGTVVEAPHASDGAVGLKA